MSTQNRNGHHPVAALNGNGHYREPDKWWRKQLARDRAIQFLGKVIQILLVVSISGFAIYGFWIGAHQQAQPDPINAIETQIENIDLDRSKAEIRKDLDEIEKAVNDLKFDSGHDNPHGF